MNRIAKRLLATSAVALLAIQAVPVAHDNPPVTADLVAPPSVRELLGRACYDCHSHETVWPWYSYVAPVSWLVAHDVEEGREHLDFSSFGALAPGRAAHAFEEIAEVLGEGEMPPAVYTPLHPEARLTADETATLRAWALEQYAALGGRAASGAPGPEGDDEDDD